MGKKMSLLLLLMALVCATHSCRTIPYTISHDSAREVHDTLRFHTRDSVWVYQKGDTLREYHVTINEREKVLMVRDTINNEVTLKGDPYIPRWGKWVIGVAAVIIVVFIIWVAFMIGRATKKKAISG